MAIDRPQKILLGIQSIYQKVNVVARDVHFSTNLEIDNWPVGQIVFNQVSFSY